MRTILRWFAYAAASVGIAFLLSWLPVFDPNLATETGYPYVESETSLHPLHLSDDNLVDHLVSLSFRQELDRVEWNGRRLSIDFRPGDAVETADDIMGDLFRLCHFAFSRTTNVDHVLVRVVTDDDQQRKQWLLALDADRSEWQPEVAEEVGATQQEAASYLQRFFRLRISGSWPYSHS